MGQSEDGQAQHQRVLPAVLVTHGTGDEQQPGEHQGVRVDDPLQLGLGGPGAGGQVGQRDVERRHGRHHQRQRDAHAGQHPPLLRRDARTLDAPAAAPVCESFSHDISPRSIFPYL
jgi:hypothetical protein